MAWFDLQHLPSEASLAFDSAAGAKAWLGGQSQTVPARMQAVLAEQFEALPASLVPVLEQAQILEVLRGAAITAHSGASKRYAFQARPLGGEAASLFGGSVRMWRALAGAYLLCLERLGTAAEKDPLAIATAAHRAMVTFRLCIEDHYLAGSEASVRIWKNAHRLMQIAYALGVADTPLADPEFREPVETTVMEQYALIALTEIADPYSLSDSEFTVLRRALMRWRNLANFAPDRDDEPKTRWVALSDLPALPPAPAENSPLWMEISAVRTKVRHRIRALDEGQTPEALHFGRDLSARGCRDFLDKLIDRLKPGNAKPVIPVDRSDQVKVGATTEDCFELIAGRPLRLDAPMSTSSDRVAHDRIAIFGKAELAGEKQLAKAGELWTLVGETVEMEDLTRPAAEGSARLLPGHLLTIGTVTGAILGVADRVMVDRDGVVHLRVRRFPGQPKAYSAKSAGTGGPLNFVLYALPAVEAVKSSTSLVLPSGIAIRIRQAIFCEGGPGPLHLGDLIERGENFERYSPGAKSALRIAD